MFIPFDSSESDQINFLEMIDHFYTVKLIEKAYTKSQTNEQRKAILENVKLAIKFSKNTENVDENHDSPFSHLL